MAAVSSKQQKQGELIASETNEQPRRKRTGYL